MKYFVTWPQHEQQSASNLPQLPSVVAAGVWPPHNNDQSDSQHSYLYLDSVVRLWVLGLHTDVTKRLVRLSSFVVCRVCWWLCVTHGSSSTCSHLPRCYLRPGTYIRWSYQTTHWSLFSLSEAVAFHQTNTDDRYHHHFSERPVVSRIDYCNAVLAGVHDVHLRQLQPVLNAAAQHVSGSMTASQSQFGTLCTGYRSSNVWSLKIKLPVMVLIGV